MESAKLAAKRGAYWLDTVYPEWFSAIDLSNLELSAPAACVLGQLTGDFDDFSAWLHGDLTRCTPSTDDECEVCDWLIEQGFYTLQPYTAAMETYGELNQAWHEQVEERR